MADRDEMQELWCGQIDGPPRKGEDMLKIAIDRTRRWEHMIRIRNWRECGAAALVTVIFAWMALRAPNALACAGNLVVAASGIWIVYYLLRFGQSSKPPAPDRNLAEFQQALLDEYERQIRLLRNVRYWYLLPPFAGLLLASTGSVMARLSERHPWWPELIAVPVYTAIFGLVWWLNESYAIGQLQRQRARLIEEMK